MKQDSSHVHDVSGRHTLEDVSIDAVKSIVSHYVQDIHLEKDGTNDAPYFDTILGHPPNYSDFIKYWIERLSETHQKQPFDLRTSHLISVATMLKSYSTIVKSHCFHLEKNCIRYEGTAPVVLIHFEMIINRFIPTCCEHDKMTKMGIPGSVDLDSNTNDEDMTSHVDGVMEMMSEVTVDLFHDIYHLSRIDMIQCSKGQSEEEQTCSARNWILPTLLRLFMHTVQCLELSLALVGSTTISRERMDMVKQSLALATITALMFSPDEYDNHEAETDQIRKNQSYLGKKSKNTAPRLNANEILQDDFAKDLTFAHLMDTTAYSPNNLSMQHADFVVKNGGGYAQYLFEMVNLSEVEIKESSFLTEPIFDLRSSEALTMETPWIDHIKGITPRIGLRLLQSVSEASKCLDCCNGSMRSEEKEHSSLLLNIMARVGIENVMLPMVRDLFFGNIQRSSIDYQGGNQSERKIVSHGSDNIRNPKVFDLFDKGTAKNRDGYFIQTQKKITTRPKDSWCDFPCSVPPTIRVIAVLGSLPPSQSFKDILPRSLPMLFALVDSNDAFHQALGASALYRLIGHSTYTLALFMDSQGKRGPSYFETTMQVLKLALQSCSNSSTFIILAKLHTCLLQGASTNLILTHEVSRLRRETVIHFFSLVQRLSTQGPNAEDEDLSMLKSLLVCGLHPLLLRLSDSTNADSLEFGRFGLAVLLPILRWNSNTVKGRQVQFSAIACLISLMMGAYPMMQLHAGKIFCELLACIGRCDRSLALETKIKTKLYGKDSHELDNVSKETHATQLLLAFTIHAASVGFVLCGESSNDVLSRIERGPYADIHKWCNYIRNIASCMMKQEKSVV